LFLKKWWDKTKGVRTGIKVNAGLEKIAEALSTRKVFDEVYDSIGLMDKEQLIAFYPELENISSGSLRLLRGVTQNYFYSQSSQNAYAVKALVGAGLLSGTTDVASAIFAHSNPAFGYLTLGLTIADIAYEEIGP
jgi:hypothetical protein